MKLLSAFTLSLLTYHCGYSQDNETNEVEKPHIEQTDKEKKESLIHLLFNTRDKKNFTDAIHAAKKIGVSDQAILEATFLYHIDQAEFTKVSELTEKFQKLTATFEPKNSKIFATKEDWLSVIEYGLALKALDQNNIPLFKKHILEAFWLSPNQAAGFAPHINQLHTANAMKNLKLKLDQNIFQINDTKPISLAQMLENKEALMVRFWSPWSQQVEQNHPIIKHLANQCAQHKISFASILINRDPQGIKDTLEVIDEIGKDFSSYWLADEDNSALTKLLRITNLPTIVIVSKEGKILYNGSLENKSLWSALLKIAPNIKVMKEH